MDGFSVEDMRSLNYPKDKNSLTYLKKVTHNVTDVIKSITFRLANHNSIKFANLLNDLLDQNSVLFGRCFSLNIPQEIQNLKVFKRQ